MKERSEKIRDESKFLFPASNRLGHVSTSAFSKWEKQVAEFAGLRGRFSGHSVRIGGATAAMEGSMTLAQIRAIGDWESKTVLLYLRLVESSQLGASIKMGF